MAAVKMRERKWMPAAPNGRAGAAPQRRSGHDPRGEVRGREAERTNQTIVALRVFLGDELTPTELDRIETVWHRSGPPADVMDRIKTVQQTPSEWRSLLPNESDGDNDPGRIPPPSKPGPPRDG